MKTRATKKTAWILSLISLLLCVSMLVGTTFAWFTDTVSSGINTIAAGVLDVELYHSNANASDEKVGNTTKLFLDVNGDPILWEPGVVSWENLRVTNAGNLALNWKLAINTANENHVIDPVTDIHYGLSQALKVGIVPGGITATERADVVDSVALSDWTSLSSFLTKGQLLPEGEGTFEETFGIVIWWQPGTDDNRWNLNNGKKLSSGEVLSIDLGVHLEASQQVFEEDSFGNDYDAEASYTFSGSYSHSTTVATDAENKVSADLTMGNTEDVVSAQVAAGTKLEAGVSDLTLTVNNMATTNENITVDAGSTANSVDVHVSGLAADNTVPVKVTVKHLLPKYMNEGNFSLYHVENGTPVLMTSAADPVNHNEYSYDPGTGDVTMALANFCEITIVDTQTRTWGGKTAQAFSGGDGTKENPFLIASADQLVLMSKLISKNTDANAKYMGAAKNSKGEAINKEYFPNADYKLISNIQFLGEAETSKLDDDSKTYYPAGYWYSEESDATGPIYKFGASFTGTFDGSGNTVSGIYQNTWQMNGYYNDGYPAGSNHWKAAMGLFGSVYNATIKNLTVKDFASDGEFTPTGCVAAFAGGNSTFENITIEGCNPRVYNTSNGGIVGLNHNDTDGTPDNLVFRNITVDQTNKISALWGSYDVGCGGILGRLRDNEKHGTGVYNTVKFENCHVAAIMDVYNDVCANYQYYQYRYCGMFVGTLDYVDMAVDLSKVMTATKCHYYIGDWTNYWYCELVANSLASYTHDHQFSRLTIINSEADLKDGEGKWNRAGNFVIPATDETQAICYHIRQDANGNFYEHKHKDAGYETTDVDGDGNVDSGLLKEDRQHYHLPFDQLFTGYGWGSTAHRTYPGITVDDSYAHDAVLKFEQNKTETEDISFRGDTVLLKTGVAYTVGDLFKAIEGKVIQKESVQVMLSADNSYLKLSYAANTTDWTKGTVTFTTSGTGYLAINDYCYCKSTTIRIAVDDPNAKDHEPHCTCGDTGVGENCDTNKLYGWVAWDGKSDIPSGGNYYLIADVDKDVPADTVGATQHWLGQRSDETGNNENVVINLCLNGHSIDSRNRIFGIGTNVTVNLMNCKHDEPNGRSTLTGSGTMSDGANKTDVQAGLIFIQNKAELNIYEGIDLKFEQASVTVNEQAHMKLPTEGGIMSIGGGSVVTMYGGTMTGGMAVTGGSVCVYDAGSAFIMKGGTISGGTATYGGNIYAKNNASVTLSGGTVADGEAAHGGNIFATGSVELTVSGTAALSGGKAHGNGGVAHGGSIVVESNSVLKLSGGSVTGGKVDSTADNENELGGNLYIGESGRLEMTGGTLESGFAADLGGNIYFAYNSKGNKIEGGKLLTGNARTGGNIYADNSSELTISGGNITGGTATSEKDEHLCTGGNLAVGRSSNVTVSGGTIADGKAEDGGNIHVSGTESTEAGADGTGVLTVTGTASITGGTATGNGGNIYANVYSAIELSGGSVSGGTATYGYGGNIYVYKNASFTVSGDAGITGGEARDGGSICLCDGEAGAYATFEMTGGKITEGTATGQGGNVFIGKYATFTMSDGTVTGGNATGGGNIAVNGTGATMAMSGGSVTGGISTGAHGGNIMVVNTATATFTGGTVSDGTAQAVADATGDALDKNGGNLSLSGNGTTVTIEGTAIFQDGIADRGGNIFYHSGNLNIGGTAQITGGTGRFKYSVGGACVHQNWTVTGTVGKTEYAGTMTISGAPVITDLCLGDNNDTLQLSNMTSGASIGVSGGSMNYKFAVADQTGYADYFHSNNPYYYDVVEKDNDGTIELWYAGHADHCVCGGTLSGRNIGDHTACANTGAEWKPWDGQSNITVGGNYYLASDNITIKDVWMGNSYVAADNTEITINLCLNGHDVTALYRAFKVSPKVTFNLMNCSGAECVVSTPGAHNNNGRVVHIHGDTSTMNMYDKVTLQGLEKTGVVIPSGGVINCNGTFNMYGGKIVGGYVGGGISTTKDGVTTYTAHAGNGGAIYLAGTATWNLYDGTVYGGNGGRNGSTSYNGTTLLTRSQGGVACLATGATLNMYDGTVYGGSVGDGGVFWAGGSSSTTINITGGTIHAGSAAYGGGAIKLQGNAKLNLSNVTIDGSWALNNLGVTTNAGGAGGGALCIHGGTAVIKDVTIQNCTAGSGKGGAINFAYTNNITLSGKLLMTGNKNASSAEDNVYLNHAPQQTLQLSDLTTGSVIGINASTTGVFTDANGVTYAAMFQNDSAYTIQENDDGTLSLVAVAQ